MTKWTHEKEKFLIDNYHKIPATKLRKELEISASYLYVKTKELGLLTRAYKREKILYDHGAQNTTEKLKEGKRGILKLKEIKDWFHVGQKIKIRYSVTGSRSLRTVRGVIKYKTDYFITLFIKGMYKESFKYTDFATEDIEIL